MPTSIRFLETKKSPRKCVSALTSIAKVCLSVKPPRIELSNGKSSNRIPPIAGHLHARHAPIGIAQSCHIWGKGIQSLSALVFYETNILLFENALKSVIWTNDIEPTLCIFLVHSDLTYQFAYRWNCRFGLEIERHFTI